MNARLRICSFYKQDLNISIYKLQMNYVDKWGKYLKNAFFLLL